MYRAFEEFLMNGEYNRQEQAKDDCSDEESRGGHPISRNRFFRVLQFCLGLVLMAGSAFVVYRLVYTCSDRMELTLYFADFSYSRLIPVKRAVQMELKKAAVLRKAILELCYGPVSNDTLPTVPGGTRLLAVWLKGDTAYVDLSKQLYLGLPDQGGAEVLAVYSLVQTAVDNVPGVKRVQILINGNPLPVLRGLVRISLPLVPRHDLVSRE